jgi:hypothetical protein
MIPFPGGVPPCFMFLGPGLQQSGDNSLRQHSVACQLCHKQPVQYLVSKLASIGKKKSQDVKDSRSGPREASAEEVQSGWEAVDPRAYSELAPGIWKIWFPWSASEGRLAV